MLKTFIFYNDTNLIRIGPGGGWNSSNSVLRVAAGIPLARGGKGGAGCGSGKEGYGNGGFGGGGGGCLTGGGGGGYIGTDDTSLY